MSESPEAQSPDPQISAAFEELSKLEVDFANVEIDALRRKEYRLRPIFAARRAALRKIPGFWRQVFLNAPDEIQSYYSSADVSALAAIEDFNVERYQISSETEGEPRSLRFEFTFGDNDAFGACTLTKEFEWKASATGDGPGRLVSKAVPIKWKNKKSDLTKGMLDMAVELEAAEEAMKMKKGGEEVELVEREGLWQYEKLREAIAKTEEAEDDEPTWLNWFGFRGAVEKRTEKKEEDEKNGENGAEVEDVDMDDEFDDGLLDVEVFPPGEDVAIALAEDLFVDAMDFFMQSQEADDFDGFDEDSDEDDEAGEGEDGDDVPELVEEGANNDKRPSKRQRTQ